MRLRRSFTLWLGLFGGERGGRGERGGTRPTLSGQVQRLIQSRAATARQSCGRSDSEHGCPEGGVCVLYIFYCDGGSCTLGVIY